MTEAADFIPAVPAAQATLLLIQLTVLLAVATVLGRIAQRFGLPAIVGELFTGVLLGPSVLGNAAPAITDRLWPRDGQTHLVDAVAQVGVVLLVALTGSELNFGELRRRRLTVTWVSSFAFVLPLLIGVLLGLAAPRVLLGQAGEREVFAAYIGVAFCVTAIPVIAKTLSDMNLLHRDVGQLALTCAAVDDAAGWFLLSLVSAVATSGISLRSESTTLLGIAGVVLVAWLLRRPAHAWAARATTGDRPGGTSIAAVLVLLGSATTAVLGLEPILGAFVVGVVLATDSGRAVLRPMRTLVLSVLAPLFLATAGLRVDLGLLGRPQVALAALVTVVLAVASKIVGGYAGARLGRLNHWEAFALGSAMNGRGLVEIVVAAIGLRLGLLTAAAYTIVVLMAIATSMLTAPLLRYTMRRVDQRAAEALEVSGDVTLPEADAIPVRRLEETG